MSINNTNFGNNIGQIGDSYTINSRSELDKLSQLLLQIQSAMDQADITTEEREKANECFDVIKEEAERNNPRKHFIQTTCDALKKIISSPHFWNLLDKLSSYFLTTKQ